MKQPIRFFSIGLLIASLIALIVFSLTDTSTPKTTTNELSTDEMINALEVEGYHVLTSSEYIKLSVGKDSNKDDVPKDKDKDKNKDDEKDKDKDKDGTKDDAQDKDKDKNKNDDEPTPDNDDASQDNETTSYTLKVEPNMLGPDVSKLLLDNNIIDDAEAFNRFLEVEGYAPYIQLGDHKVTSDMDYKQIADTIANK